MKSFRAFPSLDWRERKPEIPVVRDTMTKCGPGF